MRKCFTFFLGLMLIICLAGCSSAKMAATISAPTEATIIYTDEQTGEEQTTARTYTYDGFAIRNDEIIECKSHYVENDSRTDMVSFYSFSGTFLGSRTYAEDGTYTDYVDMADIQTFDDYLQTNEGIRETDGNTVYFEDGSYVELLIEDGYILGLDYFDASGTLMYHWQDWRSDDSDSKSEVWSDYSYATNDFTIRIDTTYEDIAVTLD